MNADAAGAEAAQAGPGTASPLLASPILLSNDVLRPRPGGLAGLKAWGLQIAMRLAPFATSVARRVWPIVGGGGFCFVTRYDDVQEVFRTDTAFGVVYAANLELITGKDYPFFLGMSDTAQYQEQLAAMQRVVLPGDLAALGDRAEALAEAAAARSGGRVEVVSFVREVTFDLIAAYFGVPAPAQGRLDVWATRLFEFQFTGSVGDNPLCREVREIAPVFRALLDGEIARRRAAPDGPDDVLGRCLKLQARGVPGYSDGQIRTALMCMVIGGPPQPPMVVPQGMNQLLLRPAALAGAQAAARLGDDARLWAILLEAMRFDPLAPALPRVVLADWTIARGTRRATAVRKGGTVYVGFASAMMDPRRVSEPEAFRPGRLPHEYIHFGQGLHACFGRYINAATLHRMVKPLLRRPGLRRAAGAEGRLRKNGIFAERLVVVHD